MLEFGWNCKKNLAYVGWVSYGNVVFLIIRETIAWGSFVATVRISSAYRPRYCISQFQNFYCHLGRHLELSYNSIISNNISGSINLETKWRGNVVVCLKQAKILHFWNFILASILNFLPFVVFEITKMESSIANASNKNSIRSSKALHTVALPLISWNHVSGSSAVAVGHFKKINVEILKSLLSNLWHIYR